MKIHQWKIVVRPTKNANNLTKLHCEQKSYGDFHSRRKHGGESLPVSFKAPLLHGNQNDTALLMEIFFFHFKPKEQLDSRIFSSRVDSLRTVSGSAALSFENAKKKQDKNTSNYFSTVARKGHTWCVLFSVRRYLRISTYNARFRLITRDLDL